MKKQITAAVCAVAIGGLIAGWVPSQKASAAIPGVNELISQSTGGALEDNPTMTALYFETSYHRFNGQQLSGDGRYVTFTSRATNLVAGDTNNQPDAFVRDTTTGTTTKLSTGAYDSYAAAISNTGRYALFTTWSATTLGLKLQDLTTGITQNVFTSTFGDTIGSSVSADGRYVIFSTSSSSLSLSNSQQVYVKDMSTGTIKRLTSDSSNNPGNGDSYSLGLSCGGNIALFISTATNLPGSGAPGSKLFAVRLGWNSTDFTLVDPNLTVIGGQISCDGTKVLYDKNDASGNNQTHVYDLSTGQNTIASVRSTGATVSSADTVATLSGDGRYVVFSSTDSSTVTGYPPTDASHSKSDVYIRDLKKSTTQLVTFIGSNRSGGASNPVISTDGSKVGFNYITPPTGDTAHELVPGLNTGTATASDSDIYTALTGL